ncbi:hypothetical protein GCM10010836_24500 [Aminobacter aminovorans]
MAYISGQDTVAEASEKPFSERLSKQDAAVGVDANNPEMGENPLQERTGTAERTASSYASNQAVYLAHCAH